MSTPLPRAREGEFLHLYTPGIGRAFFELVERRGGYDGYGARQLAGADGGAARPRGRLVG